MKRRGFLQLMGSALAAPRLPSVALGGSLYPASALEIAMSHAKSQVNFSAYSLSGKLGLGFAQTEALMRDLSQRGVLGPLQGTTQAGRWARSQVWQRPSGAVVAASTENRRAIAQARAKTETEENTGPARDGRRKMTKEQNMEKWEDVSGVAAPMPLVNIDTDMIIPKQFLKTIKRSGLGVNLFDEMRYDADGNEIADFVLNQTAYRDAEMIIAGDNFGCGSSREHAPWALKDFGIKVVVSTSFADIFYNNCFKNGILPITLPQEAVDVLMEDAERGSNARISVNLENQTISATDGTEFSFELDAFKKHCLMNGLDDIGLTMEKVDAIDAFEGDYQQRAPWL